MAEGPVFTVFLEHYDSTTHVLPLISVHLLMEGLFEVRRVKPFREPGVDRGEQVACFCYLPLPLPQPGQARSRAQFQRGPLSAVSLTASLPHARYLADVCDRWGRETGSAGPTGHRRTVG